MKQVERLFGATAVLLASFVISFVIAVQSNSENAVASDNNWVIGNWTGTVSNNKGWKDQTTMTATTSEDATFTLGSNSWDTPIWDVTSDTFVAGYSFGKRTFVRQCREGKVYAIAEFDSKFQGQPRKMKVELQNQEAAC